MGSHWENFSLLAPPPGGRCADARWVARNEAGESKYLVPRRGPGDSGSARGRLVWINLVQQNSHFFIICFVTHTTTTTTTTTSTSTTPPHPLIALANLVFCLVRRRDAFREICNR